MWKDLPKKIKKTDLWIIAFLSIAVVIFAVVVVCSILNAPIADDWGFYRNFSTTSYWGFISDSMQHTGRIAQWTLVYGGYKLFGMHAVQIIPIILFSMLSLCIAWLIKNLQIYQKNIPLIAYIITGILVAGTAIFLMPSIFDSFLWYTSSTAYIAALVGMILNINLIILLFRGNVRWPMRVFFFIVIALGQTFSEPASIINILIFGLILLYVLIKKHQKAYANTFIALVSLVIGFLIVYFSAGSIERRQASPVFDPVRVFSDSLQGYGMIFDELSLWKVMSLALTIIFFISCIDVRVVGSKIGRRLGVIALTILFATTYLIFMINNYTQDYMPFRVLTLPTFGIVASIMILSIITVKRFNKHIERTRLYIGSLALIIIFLPLFLYSSSQIISGLAIRKKVVDTRNIQVNQQLMNGAKQIRIMIAPSLLKSNADDFYYNDAVWSKNGRNWVSNSYLTYMGISSNEPADRIILVNPPDIYW